VCFRETDKSTARCGAKPSATTDSDNDIIYLTQTASTKGTARGCLVSPTSNHTSHTISNMASTEEEETTKQPATETIAAEEETTKQPAEETAVAVAAAVKDQSDQVDDNANDGDETTNNNKEVPPSAESEQQSSSPDEHAAKDPPTEHDESSIENSNNANKNKDPPEDPPTAAAASLPPRPIKRARTAYFIFTDERRPELQKQVSGEHYIMLVEYDTIRYDTIKVAPKALRRMYGSSLFGIQKSPCCNTTL
jgi:hypothetical protein